MITAYLLTLMLSLGLVLWIVSRFVDIETVLTSAVRKIRNWQSALYSNGKHPFASQIGRASIGGVLDVLVLILVGVILVFKFAPIIESSATTDNITNTTTKSFGDLASWLLPTIAILGLVYLGVRKFFHWGGKGSD